MAATTGAVPRFQISRNNTTIGHHSNAMDAAAVPKSAASTAAAAAPVSSDVIGRFRRDPQAKKDKTNSFKRHLAAARNSRNDETIRRKMTLLKEQQRTATRGRHPGGAKTPIQQDMEAEAKSRVENELGRPVSSNEWPFVYFVVSVDQVPQQVGDGEEGGEGSSRGMQTARQRQRFLVSRRRKIQEAREETERIREANIDMGLRLEPIKPQAQFMEQQQHLQRMRTRPSLTKHPPTPVSSVGSRHEFHFLNSQDDLNDLETRRSIGMIITDTLNEVGLGPRGGAILPGGGGGGGGGGTGRSSGSKHVPVSTLELPEISAGTKRRALGTSPGRNREDGGERKMVTFADGLPVIKGNGIPLLGVKPVDPNLLLQPASDSCPTSLAAKSGGTPKSGELTADGAQVAGGGGAAMGGSFLQPPWSAPLTLRSTNSFTPKSRLYTPLALPKIDIVSEIYDELIVKTIQNYLMAEGYSQEKFHQLRQTVLARLSATYPHLVKHKAWRQDPLGEEGQGTPTRESSAVVPGTASAAAATIATGDQVPGRPRYMRSGTLPSRLGRSSAEQGPTSSDSFYGFNHNLRPVNLLPFFYPASSSLQQQQQQQTDPGIAGGWGGGTGGGFSRASTFHVTPSSFMSIDGRTMTITPRCSPQSFQLGPGPASHGPPITPRLEPVHALGADCGMTGWTPPPNRLPSMVEEEPATLTTCPSVQKQCDPQDLGTAEGAVIRGHLGSEETLKTTRNVEGVDDNREPLKLGDEGAADSRRIDEALLEKNETICSDKEKTDIHDYVQSEDKEGNVINSNVKSKDEEVEENGEEKYGEENRVTLENETCREEDGNITKNAEQEEKEVNEQKDVAEDDKMGSSDSSSNKEE